MSLRDDLIAAKALIADPAKWIKGQLSHDGCYCSLGAAQHVTRKTGAGAAYYRALREALPPTFEADDNDWNSDVAQFNDDPATTHADIMALFQRAISAAEAAEARL